MLEYKECQKSGKTSIIYENLASFIKKVDRCKNDTKKLCTLNVNEAFP